MEGCLGNGAGSGEEEDLTLETGKKDLREEVMSNGTF
jgi:hypothetical protein